MGVMEESAAILI